MSEKKSILIIEDEADIQEIITDFLDDSGIDTSITVAANGIEAAILCHTQDPFDLIISDQHMPYLDGISLLKYLRKESEKNRETPFVFLSAYIKNIQSIIDEINNVHFLDKPITFEDLDKKIKELL